MQIIIKEQGEVWTVNCTAEAAMYYTIEGWDVWCTDAEWSRIHKRAHAHGLTVDAYSYAQLDKQTYNECTYSHMLLEWHRVDMHARAMLDAQCEYEVKVFIDEMNIMGMLDTQQWEDAAPMWGTACMN